MLHNVTDVTATSLSRSLAASVAPLALSDHERSTHANIKHVETPRWEVTSWLRRELTTHLALPPRYRRSTGAPKLRRKLE